jgi:hypothetical protein
MRLAGVRSAGVRSAGRGLGDLVEEIVVWSGVD